MEVALFFYFNLSPLHPELNQSLPTGEENTQAAAARASSPRPPARLCPAAGGSACRGQERMQEGAVGIKSTFRSWEPLRKVSLSREAFQHAASPALGERERSFNFSPGWGAAKQNDFRVELGKRAVEKEQPMCCPPSALPRDPPAFPAPGSPGTGAKFKFTAACGSPPAAFAGGCGLLLAPNNARSGAQGAAVQLKQVTRRRADVFSLRCKINAVLNA